MDSTDLNETVLQIANLMAVSARTAPKSAGQDFIEIVVLDNAKCQELGEEMIKVAQQENIMFERDGKGVKDSAAMVLIGIREHPGIGLECGACGIGCTWKSKEGKDFRGPNCLFRELDMGIALGSAVKTASMHNVDNRIMFRAGTVAIKMGLIDCWVAMGIPISATGKNIFFDRTGY
jgi:uncharacterized ferredoxin-like protein